MPGSAPDQVPRPTLQHREEISFNNLRVNPMSRIFTPLLLLAISGSLLATQGMAQTTGGTGGTGGTTGNTGTGGTTGQVSNTQTPNTVSGGTQVGDVGSNVNLDDSLGVAVSDSIEPPDDRETGGFAGLSTDQIVHPYSEFYESLNTGGGGGGAGIGGGRGGGVGGFGAGGGQSNGFNVIRSNVRSRLLPQINAPRMSPVVVSNRFSQQLTRVPGLRALAGNISLQVSDRTGVLTGFVQSAEQRALIERQARLAPGVYRLVNQIQISNQ